MKIALFKDALPCSSRCNASWSTENNSPTPPLKPSNSIEGAALSEQQISLQMSGLSLLYWTLLYVNAAGHKWLFVQSQKEQHCVCDTYQSLECQWWPINEGLGQRRGRLGHSIGQISSLMSLNVAPSDMTCVRLWHTQIAKRRQDLHYAALWRILQAETIVCFCCVYCCVMQATAIWIKVTRMKTVTTARTHLLETPYPLFRSMLLLLSFFFWRNTCRYTSKLENSKPMKSFANWICKHVLLDSRGQEKMDWLPKGGDAENSKPYFLCLDDSSGVGINTAWLAPGERGPLQEADISKLSIMDEKRSVRTANKRWRTNERIKYRAKGEG